MRRAFVKWFRGFATKTWGYEPEIAASMADRSSREEDHYYRLFEAGWEARKAKEKAA